MLGSLAELTNTELPFNLGFLANYILKYIIYKILRSLVYWFYSFISNMYAQ